MDKITSKTNHRIKAFKKLTQKKYRTNQYLIEGFHLLDEAIKSSAQLVVVITIESQLDKVKALISNQIELLVVTDDILNDLTDAKTPQGVIAVVQKEKAIVEAFSGHWLVLDDVQDPGNVGTMIRTADAAGLNGVILSKNSADLYNPKVLRSMQGSHFHLPIIEADLPPLLQKIKGQLPIYASTLSKHSVDYRTIDTGSDWLLVMGNEGAGISKATQLFADQLVHIPMAGRAESLNVASATGILLFRWI
ncbi:MULTISPECIES: RNA methyltransferase [unclassified Enterococcus]|uniref:TrmH family RNA methyltransferase n=1 Tax=unclassified Enterococcus TaxID=2608891 RepID=UPI0015552BA0|nr:MULTISPECIES: RNA methyltransferase [unclassified Enterococcus]MBS7576476.1 RNA methyltransferase [Enterococcus sp. MMGLQ5-2]MBS7583708.1 RNA methyltransferase [Enterococcus sp. MMGLQ5-1]NPD11569.1 RNA methyltransferase [Enterococcus sp. MMGLQ5-1]NPD36313.1 RNA methyltransferase [Enterococcus sp. MMGLQ5-2]